MKTPKPKMPDGWKRQRRRNTQARLTSYAKRRNVRLARLWGGEMKINVGDKVSFVYDTKAGPKRQIGIVLPCDIGNPDSPVFGICRTDQRSQGTGEKKEKFIRITTTWGRGFGTFNLPKVIGTIRKVSQ